MIVNGDVFKRNKEEEGLERQKETKKQEEWGIG